MTNAIYDEIGVGYARRRRPDPRIALRLRSAVGSPRSTLNVGAGAGSYEPAQGRVIALEPSRQMIAQRAAEAAPVVCGSADHLPFEDAAFDVSLAVLTMHHWPDWERGLREMRRVSRDRVVILTWDPGHPGFWLTRDYFPEILEIDRPIFPSLAGIERCLGSIEVIDVPVPADCSDGFLGAYWRRPAAYLDPDARRAISTFSKLRNVEAGLGRLSADLASGDWDERHGHLRELGELDLGYRVVVAPGRGGRGAGEVTS